MSNTAAINNYVFTVQEAIDISTKTTLEETAEIANEKQREMAAEDTGFMKANISNKMITKWLWHLISVAFYTKFVEFGTRKMRAQPFMIPGVLYAISPNMQRRVISIVRARLNGLG
jgi:HK97 gp10 family phage protein